MRCVIFEDGGSFRSFFIKIVSTNFSTELVENRDLWFFKFTQNRNNFMLILHHHFVKNETFCVFPSTKVLKRRTTPKLFLFNNHDLVDLRESNEHIQKSSENFFGRRNVGLGCLQKVFFEAICPYSLTKVGFSKKM